jgi:succinyl-CoA synthetase beta subunit
VLDAASTAELLADYGLPVIATRSAADEAGTVAAAQAVGFPVVLKTAAPGIAHKSEVGGVHLGLGDEAAVRGAYRDLAERLGSAVTVSATAPLGVELSLGLVRDPGVGPLVVVAAGGVLVELLADRVVALPPVSAPLARAMLERLRVRPMLAGWRGAPAADFGSVVAAIVALSQLAVELGDCVGAIDVNPLVCGPGGAVAVDALVVR